MKVVGLTGYAQSGKDTAASFLVEQGWKRLAFADILRQSLYNLNPIVIVWRNEANEHYHVRVQDIVDDIGWDRAKVEHPEIRQLLQRFGTEVGRELYGENFWVDRVMQQIVPGYDYVITDVRFPNELGAVRNVGGEVYKIVRPGNRPANAHSSEDIEGLRVDGVIPNSGSLEKFREAVLEAVGLN